MDNVFKALVDTVSYAITLVDHNVAFYWQAWKEPPLKNGSFQTEGQNKDGK